MAVTRADVEISPSRRALVMSRATKDTIVMIVCTLFGLVAFILCLVAETTRSQVLWQYVETQNAASFQMKCVFTGTGEFPIACAAAALLSSILAIALNQFFVTKALCTPAAPPSMAPALGNRARDLALLFRLGWQAAFFFAISWMCFVASSILLVIGIATEAAHFHQHGRHLELECTVVRQGLFAGGGIFALASASFSVAFYIAAVQEQQKDPQHSNGGYIPGTPSPPLDLARVVVNSDEDKPDIPL